MCNGIPSSRVELITYCKRQLGEPVLQVNIDDEQVNNVIDDTFPVLPRELLQRYGACILIPQITADDKTRFAASVTTTEGSTNWKSIQTTFLFQTM
ncbi:MAG: hypothetical protein CM15mV3_0720 [Caudoviricetes sp.]|nr:MAG: hypothetical protein CM15mV3_0720 [Caudoviricetes sp.]